jgi:hypothetical protein
MNNLTAIIVALIGSPIVIWLVSRFDKRNTQQHAANMGILRDIQQDVNTVGEDVKAVRIDLYNHVAHHAHKESQDGNPERRTETV